MKIKLCKLILICFVSIFLLLIYQNLFSEEQGLRREVPSPERPKIWAEASGQEFLKAEEVARQDGIRKLIERIYGLRIDAETYVYDLVLEDRELEAYLSDEIRGMRDKKTVYHEDGSCEKLMEVTLREVVETVKRSYKRIKKPGHPREESYFENISIQNRDKIISVWGSGALQDTRGLSIIRAQRAAEVDCMEKLAARIFGIQVDSETRVRDFVLANDNIRSTVAACLKGIKWSDVRITDKWVEVDGEITLATVIERIKTSYKKYVSGGRLKISDLDKKEVYEERNVIKETGKAAIEEAEYEIGFSGKPFYEETYAVEKVLGKGIIVE